MMNNPCDECIVSPMCRNACKTFERYLYGLKKDTLQTKSDTYYYLANDIRNGKVKIYFLPDGKVTFRNKSCKDKEQ
jgi:hypothetical protein